MTFLLAIALIGQSGTLAQIECDEPMTQQAANWCADQRFRAADARLNAQWRATTAQLRQWDETLDRAHDRRPGYHEQARTAQRAWIAFRDAHCTSAGYEARGGTLEPLLVSECKTELTLQRIAQLAALTDPEL